MSQINVDQIWPQSLDAVYVGNVAIKSLNNSVVLGMFNNLTTMGQYSISIGVNSMLHATGTSNVGIGYAALRDSTTGWVNTAVGTQSMAYLTTGNHNTAVGQNSGYGITTGVGNLCLGVSAAQDLTTGNANTYVGTFAQGTTTGSWNTVIGYAAMPSTATVSNEITLGSYGTVALRCDVTSITSLSDARDKKDVAPMELGIDFVNELKPVTFVWDDRNEKGKHDIPDSGFIAQDLKELEDKYEAADILKLVYDVNPEKLEASYGRLIPVLVRAIQDLSAEVEILKAKKK